MTQHCKTCDHPRRSEIDIELAQGRMATELARRFGLPKSSIQRHKRSGHVPPSVVAAFPRHRADLSTEALAQLRADKSAGVLLHLAQQRSTLLRLQDECEHKRSHELMLAASKQIHHNIELTGRTLGTFAEHERSITQVANMQILMSPEYIGLRANLIQALRPFPGARQAVGKVLERVDQAPVHWDGIRKGIDGGGKLRPRQIEAARHPTPGPGVGVVEGSGAGTFEMPRDSAENSAENSPENLARAEALLEASRKFIPDSDDEEPLPKRRAGRRS